VETTPAWTRGLTVEVGGTGIVSHVGSAALRLLASKVGLTTGLSTALRRKGFTPVHDRGQVITDLAVTIADGGVAISDVATLGDQDELLGPVASMPTAWRTLDEMTPARLGKITSARAKTRRHVWKLITTRHGRIPLLPGVENEHQGGVVDEHEQGVVGVHGVVEVLIVPVTAGHAGDQLRAH
jgi:hypothetical protein